MNTAKALKFLLAASLICLTYIKPAIAKSHLETLSPGLQQDLQLIKRLANNPRLFNAKYLDCYLGPRASSVAAPFSNSLRSPAPVLRTFWYDKKGKIVNYKLEYSQPSPNNYLAEFHILLTLQDDLLLKDTDKVLDKDAVPTLDEEGHNAYLYSLQPPLDDESAAYFKQWPDNLKIQNTKVLVYQDTHLVNIAKILVQYSGPPPLPPSQTDMQEATAYRRGAALEQHKLGDHDQAQRLLKSHLKANPDDAEAHLKLAESYKSKACINESIAQYKIALSKCGDDSDLRDKCIAGLHALKVDVPQEALPASLSTPTPGTNSFPPTKSPINPINSAPRERININPSNSASPAAPTPKSLDVGF